MSKYHCSFCDITFEIQDDKLRCPQCLRQNGLEKIETSKATSHKINIRKKLLPFGLVVFVLALLAGSVFLLIKKKTDLPKPGQIAILDEQTLKQTLIQRGVPKESFVNPFETGHAIFALLEKSSEKKDPKNIALDIARSLAIKIKNIKVDLLGILDKPLQTAEQIATALKNKKITDARSIELGVFLVALLRNANLDAVLSVTHRVDAPMKSADPLGAMARYVVIVYAKGKIGNDPLIVLDPCASAILPTWAGSGQNPDMEYAGDQPVPLDDGSVAAHFMAIQAMLLSKTEKKTSDAYQMSQWAKNASEKSATLFVAKAFVLAASGGIQDAILEAQKALAISNDAPRQTALARLLLNAQNPSDALEHLNEALKKDVTYWPALHTLAAINFFSKNQEQGEKYLTEAFKIAPDEESILQLKAANLMAKNEFAEAEKILRTVIEKQSTDQTLLQLYICLINLGKQDEAIKIKDRLLVTTKNKEKIQKLLEAIGQQFDKNEEKNPADSPPSPPPNLPRKLKLPDVSLGGN